VRSKLDTSLDRPGANRADGKACPTTSLSFPSSAPRLLISKWILGGLFHFESNSRALLELVEAAYAGLPPQMLPGVDTEFRVELCLRPHDAPVREDEPLAPRIRPSGNGLRADIDASNRVVIDPGRRHARVVATRDMLRHAYHLRTELIEFAVFILAARGIGLAPLHAACIGRQGRAVLLLGDSGAGKSMLCLHALLQELELLAEDAVFVRPSDLLATGVPNYLHLRFDAPHLLQDDAHRRWITQAPVIRRRSGVEKFEVDLRQGPGRLAAKPLALTGAVFVSDRVADRPGALLNPLHTHQASAMLQAGQPHASGQPGWRRFKREIMHKGVHLLQRGRHPRDSVDALRSLLD
jgi:hypothetical protein